jgi:sugar O-acyltransferase (sialic acid O-acetyltransferase NeuD family)
MEDIVLLGIGGHAKSIVDSIEKAGEFRIIGFLDYPDKSGFTYRGYTVIGEDSDLDVLYESGVKYAFPTVGFMGKSTVRDKLYEKLCSIGFCIPNIVDKTAIIAKDAKLVENSGIFVGKGAIINSNASIHEMSILNSGSVIEHDCEVGAFSHIAVGAVVCGGVKIGIHTMVGANATILQERIIGNRVIIGAGCTVTTNIADDEMLYSSIDQEHIYIIAEAGVNHGGDIVLAKKMIEAAALAGADAVKFQTFQTEKMVTKNASKAVYQKNTTDCQESQYQMLKKLELAKEEYLELAECCRRKC